jgi:predicted metal-dependent peptidase
VGKGTVDWRKVLARPLRGAICYEFGQRLDYQFGRLTRRFHAYKPFMPPTLRGDFKPRITVIVDTSGSMSEHELGRCLAEVGRVLLSFRTPVTIIPCDAVAYRSLQVYTDGDLARLRLEGGGGTNMVAGIEAALKTRPEPSVLLVLTDGYTPWPEQRYKTPVVFGILSQGPREHTPMPPMPPWRRQDVVLIPLARGTKRFSL